MAPRVLLRVIPFKLKFNTGIERGLEWGWGDIGSFPVIPSTVEGEGAGDPTFWFPSVLSVVNFTELRGNFWEDSPRVISRFKLIFCLP